jgi:choline dehydrogenase-like flavoprotein
MSNGNYDIIIIGSGAGGGTLAYHLAPLGKNILLLERGHWLTREPENWSAEEVFVKNRYVSTDFWQDKDGKPFQPGVHYFVGGATKMYGAALYRLRKEDFRELKHYDGISPAWPISIVHVQMIEHQLQFFIHSTHPVASCSTRKTWLSALVCVVVGALTVALLSFSFRLPLGEKTQSSATEAQTARMKLPKRFWIFATLHFSTASARR